LFVTISFIFCQVTLPWLTLACTVSMFSHFRFLFFFFWLLPLLQPSHRAPPSLLVDAPSLLTDMAMAHQAPLMDCMASTGHDDTDMPPPCCVIALAHTALRCPSWLHSPCHGASYGCMHCVTAFFLQAYPLLVRSLIFFFLLTPPFEFQLPYSLHHPCQ
jgi:hypothetical protein